jgi:prepilin-type N-terminal cleavage/methylation domain-containing protein
MDTVRTFKHPRAGFTLIELLVVITIIGILVALLTVAAVGALRSARQAEIKAEINQMDEALVEYKNKTTAFPPNAQTDDTDDSMSNEPANAPLRESQILSDIKRHLKLAFPRHQESDNLIRALAGLPAKGNDAGNYPQPLEGGMSAGEALVFWLGGFSADPRYPISGEGGPSYRIDNLSSGVNPFAADPIENRPWVFPFEVGRLGPRTDENYFDETDGRFIEYRVPIKGQLQRRRINFWQYLPRNSEQPYLYFDTSRHEPTPEFDPRASTASTTDLHVHALKKANASANAALAIQFVEPEKFQILHCGLDDAWGVEFEQMSLEDSTPAEILLYPNGPFTGESADTIVNFTTETKLEDAQP